MSHFQETFGRARYGNLWNLWKPEKLYLCHARKALIKPKLSYRFRGFWLFLGFRVSGNLETGENQQKPGIYFDVLLMHTETVFEA